MRTRGNRKDQGPPKAVDNTNTPRSTIRGAPTGTLGKGTVPPYDNGSPKSSAETPRGMIRAMGAANEADMHDPFKAGKVVQQFQQHEQMSSSSPGAGAGMNESHGKHQQRQSLESMTPKTTMRQAPVGKLGGTALPSMTGSGGKSDETPADVLRAFQRQSTHTSPAGLQASQDIPFSGKSKQSDGSPAPPPTFTMPQSKESPARSPTSGAPPSYTSSDKTTVTHSIGERQVVSGVPPKPKRGRKGRPIPSSTLMMPRHSGRYEGFLSCVNGTLNFFIFLTLLIMAVVALSVHSDKIPGVELPPISGLGSYLANLWSGAGSEL